MNEQASDQASDAAKSPSNGMEMYDRNVDAIAAFIESGCIADEGARGIELEHSSVREDGSPVNYSAKTASRARSRCCAPITRKQPTTPRATFWA